MFLCRCESQASPWEIMAVCCNLAAKRNQRANAEKKMVLVAGTKGVVVCWVEPVRIMIIIWAVPGDGCGIMLQVEIAFLIISLLVYFI